MIIKYLKKKELLKKISKSFLFIKVTVAILITGILLFVTLPFLINFNNKIDTLNKALFNQNNFRIIEAKDVHYELYPLPRLVFEDALITINGLDNSFTIEKLSLKMRLSGLYNLKNLRVKHAIFLSPNIFIERTDLFILTDFLKKNKNKIIIKDGNLEFKTKNQISIKINNLEYKSTNNKISHNFSYAGLNFFGKTQLLKNENILKLEIKELGLSSQIKFKNNKDIFNPAGEAKIKFLNNNLIVNFDFDQEVIISNSKFKNKNLFIIFDGKILFTPFFQFNLNSYVKKIDINKFQPFKIFKFLNTSEINKKFNGNLNIYYNKETIFKSKYLNDVNLNLSIQNGNLIVENLRFNLKDGYVNSNLTLSQQTGYRKLDFDIKLNIQNKKKFYDFLDIENSKSENQIFLKIKGDMNLDAKKIYFKELVLNNKVASEKDLKILKDKVEKNIQNVNFYDLKSFEIRLILKEFLKII